MFTRGGSVAAALDSNGRRNQGRSDRAAQRRLADVIALGRGVPVNVGNGTIGAVGVGGSSQTGDGARVEAGIARGADPLKIN